MDAQFARIAESVAGLRASVACLRVSVADLRASVAGLRWMAGANVALNAAILVRLFIA